MWLKKHEKAQPNLAGYLPTDGARIWVAPVDLNPGAPDFLAEQDAITEADLLPHFPAEADDPSPMSDDDPEGGD